ncbi:hypothetical protein F5144DRAFT_92483 [Chaetomium tenue]|uniref:Uncharacterized protein n=1 Tax=Chaetomium tenue TaxID=1854479 RepID=A0ACB7PFW7_9PEZI|nr:hypothetical protein F5144DRAFT_92483 [Chaetomium globosum]
MLLALNPLLDSWRMIRLLLVVAFTDARCSPATPRAPLCNFGHVRTENAGRRSLPIMNQVSVCQLDEGSCEAHIPQLEIDAIFCTIQLSKDSANNSALSSGKLRAKLRRRCALSRGRYGKVEVSRLLPYVTVEQNLVGLVVVNSKSDLKTAQSVQLAAGSRSPWLFQLDEAVLADSSCPIRHNITGISRSPHTL